MASQPRPTSRRPASTSCGVVDLREGQPPNIEARGTRGSRVESVAINGRVTPCDLARHVGEPAAELQAPRPGRRTGRLRRGARRLRADRPPGGRRGGRRRRRGRRRAGRPGSRPRLPGRQVLRLLLRGPDDEGPEVRDRGGLRLDRALQAVHDGDDGAVPGTALPRQLDPRLREGDGSGREHDRDDDRPAAALAGHAGPPRRPPAGAGEADVAASPPRGARRHDDVDGRLEAPALLRARRRGGGTARPRGRRADRRLDPRQDPRHRPRCRRVPRPRLPEPLLRPQGRAHPLRRAHGRRGPDHGRRRPSRASTTRRST